MEACLQLILMLYFSVWPVLVWNLTRTKIQTTDLGSNEQLHPSGFVIHDYETML